MTVTRRGFNALVDTRYGTMLCNRYDVYVSGGLIQYGEYSELEMQYVRRLCPAGSVVLQAGAHIGSLTIPLAQHVGAEGAVVAYEPQRLAFQCLCANVALASLENVRTIHGAVGFERGVARIPSNNPHEFFNTGGVRLNEREDGVELCDVFALDSHCPSLPRFDLLHADVEGMEEDVLRGAERLLKQFRPVLYVEAIDADKRPSLFAYMRSLGYHIQQHNPPMFNPDNYALNPVNMVPNIHSLNVVGWPSDRSEPMPVDQWCAEVAE